MSRADRTLRAILDRKAASIKGELWIEPSLARRILSLGTKPARDVTDVEAVAAAARALGLSFLGVCPDQLAYQNSIGARSKRDIATLNEAGLDSVCVIAGGFTRLSWEWGLGETLALCANRPEEARKTIMDLGLEGLDHAERALDWGASAVVLGEDIAYEPGLFMPVIATREIVFPAVERLAARCSAPMILHSDGDVSGVLPYLPGLGLRGFHSVESTGRMSLARCVNEIGGRMAIFGGFQDRLLHGEHQPAVDALSDMVHLTSGLPFCFGSASGVLGAACDDLLVLKVYQSFPVRHIAEE